MSCCTTSSLLNTVKYAMNGLVHDREFHTCFSTVILRLFFFFFWPNFISIWLNFLFISFSTKRISSGPSGIENSPFPKCYRLTICRTLLHSLSLKLHEVGRVGICATFLKRKLKSRSRPCPTYYDYHFARN